MTYQLRPYQTLAVNALYDYFRRECGCPVVVLPTGTGKSLVIAEFVRSALHNWPDTRIIVATHSRELVVQNHLELHRLCPDLRAGIYSAGVGRRDTRFPVTFAGIQSCYQRAADFGQVDLLIVDECHTISRDTATRWGQFIADLRAINAQVKVIGLSATPYRMDSGSLVKGDGALFDKVVYEYGVLAAIQEGYLAPVVPKSMATEFDLSNVHKRGGEWIAGELERAVDKIDVTKHAVSEIVALGRERRSWLLFCSGVKHAEHVAEAVREHGIECEPVTGETPTAERDRILGAFKRGELRAVTSMGVLTTGFNAPAVDLIGLLRPTKSAGLYVQMVGRGTRLAPGKANCLVLDFAKLTREHGPIDMVKVKEPGEGGGEAPVRVCEQCSCICYAGCRHCPDCGFEFPRSEEAKIDARSADEAILSTQIAPRRLDIDEVLFYRHEKVGGTPSLRVDYRCGIRRQSEWVCVAHSGFAREKASVWWAKRGGGVAPRDVDEAVELAPTLKQPKAIFVEREGRYDRVVGYEW